MKHKGSCLRIFGWAALGVALLVAAVAVYLFWPVNPRPLASHPNPAANYADAAARVEALIGQESALNPLCKTQLLTHGQKTDRVVVLVHGYTSCPQQFQSLAPQIFDLGYNVLMVPLPHHGLTDRMNTEQSSLKAEELAAYADQVVDIAQGLGEQVTMVGISLGGVTTAWAAQHRSDLDRAVIISPAFGFTALPTPLTGAYLRVYQAMGNSYTWWNEKEKEERGPSYAYPRYSSHALTQTLRLGQAVMADAKSEPLQVKSLIVVTNANDQAVNNEMTARAIMNWNTTSAGKVSTYEFPAQLKLGHDLIGPTDPEADIEAVYPKLVEFIQTP